MSHAADHSLLKREAYRALADALGESPETVTAVHHLYRGQGRVFLIGTPERFDAVLIENPASEEWMGYGPDVNALFALFEGSTPWDSIMVASGLAHALGQRIEQQMGIPVRYEDLLFHALRNPVVPYSNPTVRQLTLRDALLLEMAPEELRWTGFESIHALLRDGLAAAALVEGHIVAIAHTSARSRDYAELGVGTLGPWRNRGLSSAAAAFVADKVREAGQVPVWSTSEDNAASLRVAEKLGFTREGRMTAVILQRER